MIVSAGQCSGLDFYKIQNTVVNFEKVSFVTTKLFSWFMKIYTGLIYLLKAATEI